MDYFKKVINENWPLTEEAKIILGIYILVSASVAETRIWQGGGHPLIILKDI
jgi:hypothetical protein